MKISLIGFLTLLSITAFSGQSLVRTSCKRIGLTSQIIGGAGVGADVDVAYCTSENGKSWLEVGAGAGAATTSIVAAGFGVFYASEVSNRDDGKILTRSDYAFDKAFGFAAGLVGLSFDGDLYHAESTDLLYSETSSDLIASQPEQRRYGVMYQGGLAMQGNKPFNPESFIGSTKVLITRGNLKIIPLTTLTQYLRKFKAVEADDLVFVGFP